MATRSLRKCVIFLVCAIAVISLAQTTPPVKPFTKDEVLKLLAGEVPTKRVESLVRERGINFQITPQTETELRNSGATDSLLVALRDVTPKPPVLVITTNPGGAQVFVDDELIARTSAEGRLKISNLSAGPHKLRVSLDNYRDYEQQVDLVSGETLGVPVPLEQSTKTSSAATHSDTGGSAVKPASGVDPAMNLTLSGKLMHPGNFGGSWLLWNAVGTMTVANGTLQFKAENSEKHSFEVNLTDVSPVNQGKNVVMFNTHVQDKTDRYWFIVQSNGKDQAANQAAAKQLYQALKGRSK
jgi:hypothetical protein